MLRDVSSLVLALVLGGCSVSEMAAGVVADSLSSGGGAFTGEKDPELVREALPFGLKTYESLLAAAPDHRGLLTSTAKGYTAYAYLLQQHSDFSLGKDEALSRELRMRAKIHYLRGRDFALTALDRRYPGFRDALVRDTAAQLGRVGRADIALLYWAGAAWAGALSVAKDDLRLLAELPVAGGLVSRVLTLDESFERGTAHEFMVTFEASRPGGQIDAARRHYERALRLSGGKRASLHLALAEAVAIPEQDFAEFRRLIAACLEVEVEGERESVLINAIAHRRAHWLVGRVPMLFVNPDLGRRK